MTKKKRMTFFLSVVIGTFLAVGCTDKEEDELRAPSDGVMVECNLDIAAASNVTRMTNGASTEHAITALSALVFDSSDKYLYRSSVKNMTTTATSCKASFKLEEKEIEQRIVLIANSDVANTTVFTKGNSWDAIAKQILFDTKGKVSLDAKQPIPLFGQTELLTIGENTTSITTKVKMVRALARVDVGMFKPFANMSNIPDAPEAEALPDGNGGTYTLTSVDLYYSRTQGLVLPYKAAIPSTWSNAENTRATSVTATSIPPTSGIYADEQGGPKAISYTPTGNASTGAIFLAENDAEGAKVGTTDQQPTVLVVGITYKGKVNYYRIDFSTSEKDATRLPILRNHRYIFSIKAVRGHGADSKEEALEAGANNLEYYLDITGSYNTGSYVSGDKYFYTNYSVTVPGNQNIYAKVSFKTNITSFAESNVQLQKQASDGSWEDVTTPSDKGFTWKITINNDASTNEVKAGTFDFHCTSDNLDAPIPFRLKITLDPLDVFYIDCTLDIGRLQYDITDVKVNGLYLPTMKLGDVSTPHALTADNTLTVTLHTNNADYEKADAKGRTQYWELSTNSINGYSFQGKGTFTNGKQATGGGIDYTVTLEGTGIPEYAGFNSFTLSSDGMTLDDPTVPSVYDKSVLVPVGYTPKTMFTYSWWTGTFGYATESGGSNKFVSTAKNIGFEPKSTLPLRQLTRINQNGWLNETNFIKEVNANPDLILLGFDITMTQKVGQALADYVNQGGTVIFLSDGAGGTAQGGLDYFVSKIDGLSGLKVGGSFISGTGNGGCYSFAAVGEDGVTATDPIMAGPFGSLFGSYWGRDRNNLVGVDVTTLPTADKDLVIYSYDGSRTEKKYATFWRYKGLLWIGDGGFIAQSNKTEGDYDNQPFWIASDGTPIPDADIKIDGTLGAENSRTFGNILYWAVDRAEQRTQAAKAAGQP